MKAFRTTLMGISGIVAAKSAGQAKYRTFAACQEAGYRVKFTDCKARRVPQYDDWAATTKTTGVYDEDLFKKGWRP